MERLLCIKIASRGDLLLAAPAFKALRESRPGAEITLLVGETCRDVALHLPYFDRVLALDDKPLMAGTFFEKLGAARSFYRNLSSPSYTEVLIFHRDWRYACLARAAGIPIRRGFHSSRGGFFLTHAYRAGEQEHHIQQYLGMAGMAPATETNLAGHWKFSDGEKEKGLRSAATHGFVPGNANWVALGFGGGRNVKTRTVLKTWPTSHYRELAQRLESQGRKIVWLGDKEDAAMLDTPVPGINLSGKLSVPETAAVLSQCQLTVSNDTLTMHLSEALGVSTLGIFGPTDPAHYQPQGKHSSHLWLKPPCSPCHQDGYFPPCLFDHRCMNLLSAESVLQKIGGMP